MSLEADFLIRLIGTSAVLDRHATLEEGLKVLARLTAAQLRCESCSIMLLEQAEEGAPPRLRVYAASGQLPQEAYQTSQALGEGITGFVAASGQPLLLAELACSPLAGAARQPGEKGGLISAPIAIGGKVIGVINVKRPVDGRQFCPADLDTLRVFALFVGQSIQLVQLQNLLRSKFLQLAVAAEPEATSSGKISPDPARLARLVAKSFYRELTQAGFSPKDIISIAAEVIGLLHEHLDRHKKRLQRRAKAL